MAADAGLFSSISTEGIAESINDISDAIDHLND